MKRRDFATRMVGVGTGLAMAGGAVTAEKTHENRIKEEIRSLLMQGKVEEAEKMADKYNIEYKHSRQTLGAPENRVGPNDYLNKGNSELNLWLYDYIDNKKVVTVGADMDNKYWDLLDSADPKDGLCVTFSDNYWQPVSQSASNVTLFGDTKYISYENYKIYGVWVKIDDQQHVKDSFGDNNLNVGYTTELEKLDNNDEYNINAEYMHNWNFGGLYWINSFNLGPFGLNLDGISVDDWKLETTKKI